MRKILPALLCLVCTHSFAQQDTSLTGRIAYSKTIEATETKQKLFKRAQLFIAGSFKNPKEVVQFEDAEAGKIVVVGSVSNTGRFALHPTTKFKLTIDLKDKKYRYTYSEIVNLKFGDMDDTDIIAIYRRGSERGGTELYREVVVGRFDVKTTLAALGDRLEAAMRKEQDDF